MDVTVQERDGYFMATADLAADSQDVGIGDTPQEVIRAALRALGEPYASEMAGLEDESAARLRLVWPVR